jgi:hypothetical protein
MVDVEELMMSFCSAVFILRSVAEEPRCHYRQRAFIFGQQFLVSLGQHAIVVVHCVSFQQRHVEWRRSGTPCDCDSVDRFFVFRLHHFHLFSVIRIFFICILVLVLYWLWFSVRIV